MSWLERMVVVQTLPGVDDEQELQQDIQTIRTLLDEDTNGPTPTPASDSSQPANYWTESRLDSA